MGVNLSSRSGSAGTGNGAGGFPDPGSSRRDIPLETDAEFRERMHNLQLDICGDNHEQRNYMQMHKQYEKLYEQSCTSPHPRIVVGSLGFAKEGKTDYLQMEVFETHTVKDRPISR